MTNVDGSDSGYLKVLSQQLAHWVKENHEKREIMMVDFWGEDLNPEPLNTKKEGMITTQVITDGFDFYVGRYGMQGMKPVIVGMQNCIR